MGFFYLCAPFILCCSFGLLKCTSISKQALVFHPCYFIHNTVEELKKTRTSSKMLIFIYKTYAAFDMIDRWTGIV